MALHPQKVIVVTAPSGSGKTTLVKRLLAANDGLGFSASACTRTPRPGEVHGKDYIFLSEAAFKELIEADAFVEWEMVYTGKYYGTLKQELQRIWNEKKFPLIDIDVKGALNIKQKLGDRCLSIFIQAPSLEELRRRLTSRGTESPENIEERMAKATEELTYSHRFDKIVVNENLDGAVQELMHWVTLFMKEEGDAG